MTDSPSTPPRRTTWTVRQNIARVLWSSVARLIWVLLPPSRSSLIRLFGGRVGPRCRFARSSVVYIPWNVTIGESVQIGPRAMLYSLGEITIGDRATFGERAHLCAGTHDMGDPSFRLITPPITIGEESFLGFDVYVAPGVDLGARCRVRPRASVYRSFPDESVLRGNPARGVDQAEDSG